MMKNACQKFKKENGFYPENIFFFRDGVGEGQENLVLKNEIQMGAKKAFHDLKILDKTKMVVVVCIKTIHTKFFVALNEQETKNPEPGTIVDEGITALGKEQFFLVSPKDAFATVAPTKYNVILNETAYSLTEIENFTFRTTHLYYNYSGTIKVPHVCQMSHFAAAMGNVLKDNPAHQKVENLPYYE